MGRIRPAAVAEALYSVSVDETQRAEGERLLQSIKMPQAALLASRGRIRVYLEAALIMLLSRRAREHPACAEVLTRFESYVFPPTPTNRGLAKLDEIKGAITRLCELVQAVENREVASQLEWARHWLSEVGFVTWNPAALTLFSGWWVQYLGGQAESLEKICARKGVMERAAWLRWPWRVKTK